MKKLFILAFLVACSADPPVPIVYSVRKCSTMEHGERLAKFIIDCAAAANPKSDEEGEDLVAQCQETAEEILCPMAGYARMSNSNQSEPCTTAHKKPEFAEVCKPYL